MPYEFTPDDMDFLNEIYSLKEMHYDIVKENMKLNHLCDITGDESIAMEGFSDIVSKMVNFFKEMIKKIKEFFRKIIVFVDSYFMELDKFTTKYKKELDAVKTADFTIQGYKYTLHDAPDMSPFRDIVNSYNSGLAEASKMNKDTIKKEQNEYLHPTNMDKIRATIMGAHKPVSDEDFTEEIRKFYRNGESDKVEIKVDMAMFKSIISGAKELTDGKKEAIKTRDTLIALLDKAQTFFDKKVSIVYREGSNKVTLTKVKVSDDNKFHEGDTEYVSESGRKSIEQFIRFKYNQTHAIASIVSTVACERANAYKDNVKFHMEIIRQCLSNSNTKTDIGDVDKKD